MATVVSIDAHEGCLRRYEIGGQEYRLTHMAHVSEEYTRPVIFSAKIVEEFRILPDEEFSVDPPPRPTNPPAAAGRVAIAA